MSLPFRAIVAAFGMTGGMSSGVTYLGTNAGSRVPPAMEAYAASRNLVTPLAETHNQAPAVALHLMKSLRVNMRISLSLSPGASETEPPQQPPSVWSVGPLNWEVLTYSQHL